MGNILYFKDEIWLMNIIKILVTTLLLIATKMVFAQQVQTIAGNVGTKSGVDALQVRLGILKSSAIDAAGDFGQLSIVGKPWLSTETFDNSALSFLGVCDVLCAMSEVDIVYKLQNSSCCFCVSWPVYSMNLCLVLVILLKWSSSPQSG